MALVYVLEDDQNISEIEKYALTASAYQVEVFASAADFYRAIEQERPDLIILDIMLPDADGYEIIRKLRADALTAEVPVLMVTAKTAEIDKVRGLDLGADDYLTKPFGIMELISRVKALLRRAAPRETTTLLKAGRIAMDDERHKVMAAGTPVELTFKEYGLLKLLLGNAGKAVSREEILNEVWGTDFEGESRTLDMHIRTLRKKLGEEGERIRTLRNVGYVIEP
ncbi:MAG: response regulator transcription factor [Eubacteriales bacterium]|nr:response regulator transcription factor [Eubacteriales bacterium]